MRNGNTGDAGDLLDGGSPGVTDLQAEDDHDAGGDESHDHGKGGAHASGLASVVGEDAGEQEVPHVPKVNVQGAGLVGSQQDGVDDNEQREAKDAERPSPGDGGHRGPTSVDGGEDDASLGGETLGGGLDGARHEAGEHVHAGESDAERQGGDERVRELHLNAESKNEHDQRDEDCGSESQDVVNDS